MVQTLFDLCFGFVLRHPSDYQTEFDRINEDVTEEIFNALKLTGKLNLDILKCISTTRSQLK